MRPTLRPRTARATDEARELAAELNAESARTSRARVADVARRNAELDAMGALTAAGVRTALRTTSRVSHREIYAARNRPRPAPSEKKASYAR
jgi:hypothetical protein